MPSLRFFRRRYWDEERSRELEAYLEIETDENIARGMPPDEARLAARRKLGNPTQPIAFLAATQNGRSPESDQILVRSNAPLGAVMFQVRGVLGEIGPGIAFRFHVLQVEIRYGLVRERLMATLSGFFGFLAGLLATIGLYGVMSYMVARRRSEIGIRMALGADRRDVVGMVLREAALLVGVGLGIGTMLALAAAGTAKTLLFGLEPNDPWTIALAVVALSAVGVAASYLPARRAARMDPMVALREE